MSDLTRPADGLFFGSALFNEELMSFEEIKKLWVDRFGESVEFYHPFFPMKDYYSKQMGESSILNRVLFASLETAPREELVEHKVWADLLEKKLMEGQKLRPLNLDIGVLTLENMVLATGKSFAHRIYLGQGVYADLNLQCEQKSMRSLPWTYPDYSHPEFIYFFNWLRGFLHKKISKKILD